MAELDFSEIFWKIHKIFYIFWVIFQWFYIFSQKIESQDHKFHNSGSFFHKKTFWVTKFDVRLEIFCDENWKSLENQQKNAKYFLDFRRKCLKNEDPPCPTANPQLKVAAVRVGKAPGLPVVNPVPRFGRLRIKGVGYPWFVRKPTTRHPYPRSPPASPHRGPIEQTQK